MNNIKEYREKMNLSARQLALKLGVSPSTITRWEHGDIKQVGSENLMRLAEVLQCAPEDLISGTYRKKSLYHNRLKELRKSAGISADEIAIETGVNRATIFRYENSTIEDIPGTLLLTLAHRFHVTPEYLAGMSDDMEGGKAILDKDEAYLVSTFRSLSEFEKGKLIGRIEAQAGGGTECQ